MGPDGAIYIADWYNPIIQHGEVDFRDERRDREHGRIWRVSFPGRPADPWPRFSELPTGSLVELLEDEALPVRQFARQELWKRMAPNQESVVSAVRVWANERPGKRHLELLWINESLEAPIASDLVAAMKVLQAGDARQPPAILRSLFRNRVKLNDKTLRDRIESFALSETKSEVPSDAILEAVVIAGQLDGTVAMESVMAATKVLKVSQNPDLDFAIWQSARSIAAKHEGESSILADVDWEDDEEALAKMILAIGDSEGSTGRARCVWAVASKPTRTSH